MSIFSTISSLVADYQLWQRYKPVVDDVEAVLLKHGINVVGALAKSGPSPVVVDIQTKLNELIETNPTLKTIHPPVVDGLLGPATLEAIHEVLDTLT